MSNVPADLKYAKSHEWVRASGDAAVVGITDHAQHELTDIVYVELPTVGDRVEAGKECAVVESVKAASDIYAPASGEVIEINPNVEADPSLVNTDPYGAGWMVKIRLSDPSELSGLKNAESYREFLS